MNDKELDDMLNVWSVPPARTSLRDSVRAAFVTTQKQKKINGRLVRWIRIFVPSAGKGVVAGVALGVIALVFMVVQAFSQSRSLGFLPVGIPFTVDSEFLRYADNGSSSVDMYSTSFNHNGRELTLSSSIPGHPFTTAIRRTLDAVGFVIFGLTTPFRARAEQGKMATATARVNKGCINGPIVGRETILGYPTVATQHPLGKNRRITMWMAPELECFALRITEEEQRANGTFRMVSRKEALSVDLKQ